MLQPQDKFCNIANAIISGDNKMFHNVLSEAIFLDESWVDCVEANIHSIEAVIKNPKRFIKDDEIIVEVEKARRTTSRTVQHLASHTKNIAAVGEDGSIKPKRVLTVEMEEDIGIYENRFVCSLIDRLLIFVERRYKDINEKMHAYDTTNIKLNSKFALGDNDVSYKIELALKQPPHDRIQLEKNKDLVKRIELIRKRIRVIIGTPVYRKLSNLKPVNPPIMKTNIITMNVDYKNCYALWMYISAYSAVGYSVDVKDKDLPVDNDYFDDMTVISALSVKALIDNESKKRKDFDKIEFGETKEKQYKVFTNFKYSPSFKVNSEQAEEDSINEYYFKQMKDAIRNAVSMPAKNAIVEDRELDLSFSKFFRTISKINNQLYSDIIDSQCNPKETKKVAEAKTPLQVKEDAYKVQSKIYKRYKALSRLKSEELDKALTAESREYVKLTTAKYELDKAKDKAVKKKAQDKLAKEKVKLIMSKADAVKEKAQQTQAEMIADTEQKIFEQEEKRRIRREEAKKRRELKQLEALKEKYEGYNE